jgi:hypothetical protein
MRAEVGEQVARKWLARGREGRAQIQEVSARGSQSSADGELLESRGGRDRNYSRDRSTAIGHLEGLTSLDIA